MNRSILCALLAPAALVACGGATPSPAPTTTPGATDEPGPGRGGRAYDSWTGELGLTAPASLRRPDGVDVTDTGHAFRLKNFYGWDLRGAEGIYGARYHAKPYVLGRNWLAGSEPVDAVLAILRDGDHELPAFGAVLPEDALREIAQFIVDVRDRTLAHPDDIFTLVEGSPGNYALRPGADPARGAAYFADTCADCHGDDGTAMLFDDGAYSLGTHSRQKAYEDWFKILNGHPGSAMARQVSGTGAEMGQTILDVLAALCDRGRFPAGAATGGDVPDGDPRCGAYLR